MGMSPMWNTAAGTRFLGELVTLENDYLIVKIGKNSRGKQAGNAAADHDGSVSVRI
jgi:hypothetical protein